MTTLIYRNKETTSFIEEFNKLANDYVSKLTFTTREEYLAWVKQWKKDMKLVELDRKFHLYDWKVSACVRPEKIAMYQAKLDKLDAPTPEQLTRIKEIEAKYLIDYNLKPWFVSSHYTVWYMLILRKASKIRAAQQRELRLQNIVAA